MLVMSDARDYNTLFIVCWWGGGIQPIQSLLYLSSWVMYAVS